jgi:hypothetical protein
MEYRLFQDVTIPADGSSSTLEWQDRVQWNFNLGGFANLPRTYDVQVRDPATNAVLETLFIFSTGTQATNPTGDTGWQAHSADLSSYAGITVRLFIRAEIPEAFTGPGQVEIDGITLNGDHRPTNVDRLIANFIPDESGTFFARVGGSDGTDYSLLVTRNADFDTESNDAIDLAQPVLAPRVVSGHWILGHVPGPGVLYGSSRDSDVFTIDTGTGVGTPVGNLGLSSTEIEFDRLTGRAFNQLSNGAFSMVEFDVVTGAAISGPVFNGAAFNGLEFVGPTLYGTAIPGPGGPSTLLTLDPVTGASVAIGATGVGPISGLAYDDVSGVMYGIAGGSGPSDLYTIDLATGIATVVGSTGFQAGSLEFGPDGYLYGGATGPADGGNLYRIDIETGTGTLVGPTGFPKVTGLTLVYETKSDFYEVRLRRRQPLSAATFTPAGKSGEFANDLDPSIRIYDADGNLVASDDNSASDGRNARVSYRAPRRGRYYVEVTTADETVGGEYVLGIRYAEDAFDDTDDLLGTGTID